MKKFETIQEAADYSVLKMVEQGGRCINKDFYCCAYEWVLDGRKTHCAIGHLVLDSKNLHVEGGVSHVIEKFSDSVNYGLIKNNLTFFKHLQMFHDVDIVIERGANLDVLSRYIDTSKPQYKQWVEMV